MKVYVTWKTSVIDGCNSEGWFIYSMENEISDDTIYEWIDYVKSHEKPRAGGDVIITGIFKL